MNGLIFMYFLEYNYYGITNLCNVNGSYKMV